VEEAAMEEFEGIETADPNAVLVGLAPDKFGYESLTGAMRILLDGGKLVAIHKGMWSIQRVTKPIQ
jgi:hypothetical protein